MRACHAAFIPPIFVVYHHLSVPARWRYLWCARDRMSTQIPDLTLFVPMDIALRFYKAADRVQGAAALVRPVNSSALDYDPPPEYTIPTQRPLILLFTFGALFQRRFSSFLQAIERPPIRGPG